VRAAVRALSARPRRLREGVRFGGAGFSMMEVLAVISIVAILAMLALPSYQEKIVRDQIVEALPLADIAKTRIADAWAGAQSLPADNAAAGLPPADKIVRNYVSALEVRDGAIEMTFGNRVSGVIQGKVLTLRPAVVEDAPIVPIAWICGYASVPAKMTVKGIATTSVPTGLLPLRCR
jgi:type IV pilus assembly protein PilA